MQAQFQPRLSDEICRCRKWIEAALEYSGGTHNFDDIVQGIVAGRMQLWPGKDGCIVTEIVVYPQKKVLNVFLGGGEMSELLNMHSNVIAWAKKQGCEAITISGREGWKRALKNHGWKPLHVTMTKEI